MDRLVGKTETARCLSEAVGGELPGSALDDANAGGLRVSVYAEHFRVKLRKTPLARESNNVVLIDEFDKADPACTT